MPDGRNTRTRGASPRSVWVRRRSHDADTPWSRCCGVPRSGEGPFQGKAIGENPISPVAPAIANAVYDAVGCASRICLSRQKRCSPRASHRLSWCKGARRHAVDDGSTATGWWRRYTRPRRRSGREGGASAAASEVHSLGQTAPHRRAHCRRARRGSLRPAGAAERHMARRVEETSTPQGRRGRPARPEDDGCRSGRTWQSLTAPATCLTTVETCDGVRVWELPC